MEHIPSPNFDERKTDVDMLVIHYTGRPSLEESLAWLCDPSKKVSSHYLISEAGDIFYLVEENKRAWHAGQSFWKGQTDINSCSIGIELQNPGHEFGYRDFPQAQIEALIDLSKDILKRHKIPPSRVLGHSDVAPLRKIDPGPKFPWKTLAENGIGLWPDTKDTRKTPLDLDHFMVGLGDLGFDISDRETWMKSIQAFHMHWCPENLEEKPTPESFARLIWLLRQSA